MADEVAPRSQEKETLLALRALRQRLEELEDAAHEPIAIVGLSCRFPGGVNAPGDYWHLLQQKRSAVREIPAERMVLDPVFDSHPQTPGMTYSRWAGLLDAPGDFDAEFFGVSPREAVSLDPQQRMLLEVTWEALESAAIDPKSLVGQNAGVFVGITTSEYAQLLSKSVPREEMSAYTLQGAALNATAGRLSYFYGLNGPSMAIDTACSSSLVAVDRACRSLREGETGLAIAAGVNLIASVESLIVASQWGMLSSSGEVRAFDAGADGFVRGEGCGVLLLKRLSSARECGDRILGLILGSAVNQDGASSGLTVPNGLAQQALLRQAHRRSGIESWQVGYVEAHGTGTALGDPIEAEALGAVFGPARRADKLLIGSVKTNIGHLESAAGVAGLIKLVLSLQHGVIPGQLHWNAPSEHVRWNELGLEVVTEARAWEPIGGRRIGGVSSFGFSGTNAHTVVESWEQPPAQPELDSGPEVPVEVLVLSARSEAALRDLLERYAAFLAESEAAWSAICWTAAMGRAVFAERLAVVAPDKAEAAGKLRAWLRGENPAGVYRGQVGAGHRAAAAVLGAEASMEQAAAGFVQGNAVDWEKRSAGRTLRRTALPAYPFQRQRYWIEPSGPASQKLSQEPGGKATGRAMLGWRIRSAGVRGQYETLLREAEWVGGHRVEGRAILPATGHLELMLEASAETLAAPCVLEQVLLQAPLTVQQERRIQTVVETETGGRSRVRVYAEQPGGTWEPVSEGWLKPAGAAPLQPPDTPAIDAQAALDLQTAILNIQAIQDRLRPVDAGDAFYASLAARGLDFGQRFRGVQRAWAGQAEALGEIVAPLPGPGWEIAPWWLDACLQVAALAADAPADAAGPPDTNRPPSAAQSTDLYLPMSLDRLQIYRQPEERSWSHISFRRIDQHTLAANLTVANTQGNTVLHCANLQFRKVKQANAHAAIYGIDWLEAPVASTPVGFKGHWAVLAADNLGAEVCSVLRRLGATSSLISSGPVAHTDGPAYRLAERDVHGCREVLRAIVETHGTIEGVIDLRPTRAGDLFREATGDEPPDPPGVVGGFSLVQALLREQIRPTRGVWQITRGVNETGTLALSAVGHAIQAFRRTAALEFPEIALRHLEFDSTADANSLLRAISCSANPEILMRGDQLFAPQLVERVVAARNEENVELVPAETGRIDDLQEVFAERKAIGDDEVEIAVHAHGLNFRDVMTSLNMLPGTMRQLGGECAGIVIHAGLLSGFAPGQRVFAFAPASFKRFVTVRGANVAKVPERLSMAQAASLPVVYLTALYGLDRLAGLRPGDKILIHSAAGGLGLAAINVAKARGAEIYATAGSEEKRAYLRSIGIPHVLPSRTTEFAEEVMRLTQGRGVDVILNSLTGDLAEKTLSVASQGARFLEVGKRDTLSAEAVRQMRSDVRHFIYDLGEESTADASLVPSLQKDILQAIATGEMSPLPVKEFSDAREAFRFMAQARHIGKVIVTRSDTAEIPALANISADATYLITGAFGSLGLLFAEWLVDRGARHLVLVGHNAPSAPAQDALQRIRTRDAELTLAIVDVGDRNAMETILQNISPSSPLRGILHAAGTLDDRSLLEQSPASLAKVMRPKWHGAWNLHLLTRDYHLDFFVLFSSAAVVLGSPGQANYAVANAMLDALAAYRRGVDLPALSIQWGPWNSPGMTRKLKTEPEEVGLASIAPLEGFAALQSSLAKGETIAAVLSVGSWNKLVASRSTVSSSLLCSLSRESPSGLNSTAKANAEGEHFHLALMGVVGAARRSMLMEHLRQLTVKILSLPTKTRIDEDEALHDLGLDSLMAVELRNALMTSLSKELPATTVLDYPTVRMLTDFLLQELSKGLPLNEAERGLGKVSAKSDKDIETISEKEAEALLLAELRKR